MMLHHTDRKVTLDDINEQLTIGSRSRYMGMSKIIDKFILGN